MIEESTPLDVSFDDVSIIGATPFVPPVNHELTLDDFEAGDFEGWRPVNALAGEDLGATNYDASSGALHISSQEPVPFGSFDFIALEESFGSNLYSNGIFRAVVGTTHEETDAFLAIRTSLNEDEDWFDGGFLLAFGIASAGGSIGIIDVPDSMPLGEQPLPGIRTFDLNLGFDRAMPHNLEVIADEGNLSLSVWEVGTERPETPMISIPDAEIDGGGIAFGVSTSPPVDNPFSGFLDSITFEQLMPGDFDNSKTIDAFDIDLLASELRQSTQRRIFDMNNDGLVSLDDHAFSCHFTRLVLTRRHELGRHRRLS